MKTKKILPQLLGEIFTPIRNFMISCGEEYESTYYVLLNLFLNFLVIFFLVRIISNSTSSAVQVVVSLILVIHLFLWLCWSLKDILKIKNGGKE